MRGDYCDVTVVLDRSGSMAACKSDAEGGLNAFVEEQKKGPGKATYTLVQFDGEYEVVHKGIDIQAVGPFTLSPRGSTALLDAVGRAIVETGDRIKAMPEGDRPGLVVFAILTDGEENASREYTNAKVREMISHQQDVYKWQFTFLGANQDAFAAAGAIGIARSATMNYSQAKTAGGFVGLTGNVMRMRAMASAGDEVKCEYTDAERTAAV